MSVRDNGEPGHGRANVRAWLGFGTGLFLTALDRLSDADLAKPIALDGWTRAHVLAHVHYNAEALRRLVSWAATGVETPMYPDPDARAAEIEAGAALPAAELRELVPRSAAALAADLADLPEPAWEHRVRTIRGRVIPAGEIPWMRVREVAVHAIDLDAGVTFHDLPDDLNAALIHDALTAQTAHLPALAAWLTGRAPTAPALGRWL